VWLAPGGWLLVETSDRQAPATLAAFAAAGLRAEVVAEEELAATVVVGQLPP
jgi:release factor glutamine methyltransferase